MADLINIMRHESVFDPSEHDYPIHIIGAGATGSRVFAALVELGIKQITVYDPDTIESHNLANQIYNAEDIGETKVTGCMRFLQRKLGLGPDDQIPAGFVFHPIKVTEAYLSKRNNISGGIVFLLTDTMDSRREIFTRLSSRCGNIETSPSSLESAPMLIIETRMGSTHGTVFTINPFDLAARKAWLHTLVDDTNLDSIELSPCGTTLSVGTTASLIANYAVWQMMQFFVDPVGLQAQVDLFFKPTLTITSSAIAA